VQSSDRVILYLWFALSLVSMARSGAPGGRTKSSDQRPRGFSAEEPLMGASGVHR